MCRTRCRPNDLARQKPNCLLDWKDVSCPPTDELNGEDVFSTSKKPIEPPHVRETEFGLRTHRLTI